MENYKFNKQCAKEMSHRNLFIILIGLIEVQRLATLYRSGASSQLAQFGICRNLKTVADDSETYWLAPLFFKNTGYPIPYWVDGDSESDTKRKARWGDNDLGNQRMAMLNLMIKDLTNYLTNEAVV